VKQKSILTRLALIAVLAATASLGCSKGESKANQPNDEALAQLAAAPAKEWKDKKLLALKFHHDD